MRFCGVRCHASTRRRSRTHTRRTVQRSAVRAGMDVRHAPRLALESRRINPPRQPLTDMQLQTLARVPPRKPKGSAVTASIAPVIGCQNVMTVAEWFRDVLGFNLDPNLVFVLDDEEGASYAILDRDGMSIQ